MGAAPAGPGAVDDDGCEGVSACVPDWTRESKRLFEWCPPKSLLASIRSYQRHRERNTLIAAAVRRVAVIRHRFWSVVTGADIPLGSKIAGGLSIPHPNGIVVHPKSHIGPNCMLFQQVTIGVAGGGFPTIGGHVDIGAGAKILGPVQIGDHAVVGANAVVTRDVGAGTIVAGIPARILRHRDTPSSRSEQSLEPEPLIAGLSSDHADPGLLPMQPWDRSVMTTRQNN